MINVEVLKVCMYCVYIFLPHVYTQSRKTNKKLGELFTSYIIDKGPTIYIFLTQINQLKNTNNPIEKQVNYKNQPAHEKRNTDSS